MLQVTETPRASWRYLLMSGALVALAYAGFPLALYLCRASSSLDGLYDGLGLLSLAGAGLTLAYVVAGAPVVLRLLARDLALFESRPIVRAEWLLAWLHFFVWVAAIVALPFYVAHWAIP